MGGKEKSADSSVEKGKGKKLCVARDESSTVEEGIAGEGGWKG